MRIRDITDPNIFQDLVQSVLAAEYGPDFEIVYDGSGDGGEDGFLRTAKTLFAMYCPETRPAVADYIKRKIRDDLAKVKNLRDNNGYDIERWTFVTPIPLEREIRDYLLTKATEKGFIGVPMSELHIRPLFDKHPELHARFVDLAVPNILAAIQNVQLTADAILAGQSGQATVTAQANEVQTTEEARYYGRDYEILANLFPDQYLLSGRLLDAQNLVLEGNYAEAARLTEEMRLEPQDEIEELWATIQAVQNETQNQRANADLDAIQRYCVRGITIAERLNRPLGTVFFKSTLSNILDQRVMILGTETLKKIKYQEALHTRFISEAEKLRAAEEMTRLLASADVLFDEASAIARDNNLFFGYSLVLFDRILGLNLRWNLFRFMPGSLDAAPASFSELVARSEALIRLAHQMGDEHILSQAYSNLAQAMVFHDREKARRYAEKALEIARRLSLDDVSQLAEGVIVAAETGSFPNGLPLDQELVP